MSDPQAESGVEAPARFLQQLEARKRRRVVALLLAGLAALLMLIFWPRVSPPLATLPPVALPPAMLPFALPFTGAADMAVAVNGSGTVFFVGYNMSQSLSVWAPPGLIARWDVVFCNAADGDVSVVVKVVEVPKEVRYFLFYINETRFGWDGVNYTEWRTLFRPKACVPGKLEFIIDARAAAETAYRVKMDVKSRLLS